VVSKQQHIGNLKHQPDEHWWLAFAFTWITNDLPLFRCRHFAHPHFARSKKVWNLASVFNYEMLWFHNRATNVLSSVAARLISRQDLIY